MKQQLVRETGEALGTGAATIRRPKGQRIALGQRGRIGETLRSLGCNELFAAHLLGGGLHLAPSVDDKVVLGEEIMLHLERFELLAALHESIGDGDLLRAVGGRLRDLPSPHRWSELTIARFLLSGAARAQRSACAWSAATDVLQVLEPMLVEEREHDALAEGMMRDLFRRRGGHHAAAQADLERWLRVVLLLLQEQTTSPGRRPDEAGPRRDDHQQTIAAYLSSLVPAVSACGLRLPSAANFAIGTLACVGGASAA